MNVSAEQVKVDKLPDAIVVDPKEVTQCQTQSPVFYTVHPGTGYPRSGGAHDLSICVKRLFQPTQVRLDQAKITAFCWTQQLRRSLD